MSDRAPKQKIEPPATTAPAAEASIPPEMVEALDEDEAEFQALRRDVEGVKDAAAAGIVTIAVDKVPGKNNQFFRTCRDFKAVVPIAIQPVGLDKHFLAVAPSMVAVLAGIGISVANHTLYLTVTTRGAVSIIPVRCAGDDGVDHIDIDAQQIAPIIATRLQELSCARIAELHERGLVDLHVAAAYLIERLQLLVISVHEIRPKFIEAWIGAAIDVVAAGAVMDVGGAGQRDFRRARRA